VSEPPADILRRLRPIPTYTEKPATRPHDIVGVGIDGAPRTIVLAEAAAPLLLLFLAADCDGCRDLWAGLSEIEAGLEELARLVVLTKSPGDQDPARIATLAGRTQGRPGIDVVMSGSAFTDYRAAAPFFVVVDARAVRTEGVAWGVGETLRAALSGLARD
jgi:hypothetical protein